MSTKIYEFTKEVQDDIIRLMVKDHMFSGASQHWVRPEYFKGDGRRWLARFILEFIGKYGVPPTAGQTSTELVQQAKHGKVSKALVKEMISYIPHIFKNPISGVKEYTLEHVQQFARHQAWEQAIVESLPYHKRGDMEKVDEIMMRAQTKACDMDTDFYWYFEGTKERIRRRRSGEEKPFLPTGILELDIHFRRGGVVPGEIALWMAPKGRGKCLCGDTIIHTPQGPERLVGFVGTDTPGWHTLKNPKVVFDAYGKEIAVNRVYCNGFGPTRKVILRNGKSVEGTAEHRLLAASERGWCWKNIGEMKKGDWLAGFRDSCKGEWRPVEIERMEDSENMTYDFEVPETHSFIANGIISHNSIGLSHVTRRAIYEGWKVAYYSFEMSVEQNADRLDSGFTNISMWDLAKFAEEEEEEDELLEKLDRLGKMFPKSLGIKQYPTKARTMHDIRSHLETVRAVHGWHPNMIVVDYAGIVKPVMRRDKKHEEMQEVLEDFRALCIDFDCVGWTAAQINRSGAKKEVSDGTDAAGSWDQLQTADHIFTLNQTREEKQRGELRIFIDKCRDGNSEFEIGPLRTDWAKMAFVRHSGKSESEVRREFKERYQRKDEE